MVIVHHSPNDFFSTVTVMNIDVHDGHSRNFTRPAVSSKEKTKKQSSFNKGKKRALKIDFILTLLKLGLFLLY